MATAAATRHDDAAGPPAGCTFDPAAWNVLAHRWHPVARVIDVIAQPFGTMLLDTPLVVYRAGDTAVVADDICPHRGVPLSLGTGHADGVACAYHGLRFGVDGRCVHVPAHAGRAIPDRLRVRTYPAVERYGLVWTLMRAGAADPPAIPWMPHGDDADFQQVMLPFTDFHASAGRQIEGFIDVAHFAFIHAATFGDPDNPRVSPYVPRRTQHGFEVEYRTRVGNYPIGADGIGREGFEWLRHFRVHLPFTATLTTHFPCGGEGVIMNAASPMSARRTRLFAPMARNFDTDQPVSALIAYNLRIFEEDRAVVEAQIPQSLPLDPAAEAHIPADRASLTYRRGLREMGISRFFDS